MPGVVQLQRCPRLSGKRPSHTARGTKAQCDRGTSVHILSPGMKRRCFHSAREGNGSSRGVGSEQNYFEGGFMQLIPNSCVVHAAGQQQFHLSGCQPRGPWAQVPLHRAVLRLHNPASRTFSISVIPEMPARSQPDQRQPWQGNQHTNTSHSRP